jgi:Ca2+-transporting ATPase
MYVLIELILALNFRSLKYSIFQAPPHRSLVWTIIVTLAFTAGLIQISAVRESFGITLPAASDLGIILALGLFVTITIEITKAVLRAKAPVVGGVVLGATNRSESGSR